MSTNSTSLLAIDDLPNTGRKLVSAGMALGVSAGTNSSPLLSSSFRLQRRISATFTASSNFSLRLPDSICRYVFGSIPSLSARSLPVSPARIRARLRLANESVKKKSFIYR